MPDPSDAIPAEERLCAEAAVAAIGPDDVGDNTRNDRGGVEPAMAGIPAGAAQRMPGMASAGLPPVHPEEQVRPLQDDASERVEAVAGNRPRIAEGPPPGSFANVELRRVDAGAGSSPSAPDEGGSEGLAWLILPGTGRLAALGSEASSGVRIALPARIADAVLGMLEEAVKGLESGVAAASRPVSEDVVPIGRLDSPDPGRPPYVRAAPDRIACRPRPEQWRDDELLTLPEAARLFWPDGPLTTTSLRTAARDGTLEIRTVAGRHMTTPAALRRLGLPRSGDAAPGPSVAEAAASMLERLERRRH